VIGYRCPTPELTGVQKSLLIPFDAIANALQNEFEDIVGGGVKYDVRNSEQGVDLEQRFV